MARLMQCIQMNLCPELLLHTSPHRPRCTILGHAKNGLRPVKAHERDRSPLTRWWSELVATVKMEKCRLVAGIRLQEL